MFARGISLAIPIPIIAHRVHFCAHRDRRAKWLPCEALWRALCSRQHSLGQHPSRRVAPGLGSSIVLAREVFGLWLNRPHHQTLMCRQRTWIWRWWT